MSNRDQDETGAPAVAGAASASEEHPPSEVAHQLRAARERAGYELIDIAAALRIRHAHLLAIEEGRMTDLPGPAYAVGFLRSYAEILGLDGDAVVRLFKDEVRGFDGSGKLVFPAPVEEGKRPTAALVALSLLVAGAIYGGWHYLSVTDRTALESVSEPPERLISLAEQPPPAVAAVDASEAEIEPEPEPEPEPQVQDPSAPAPELAVAEESDLAGPPEPAPEPVDAASAGATGASESVAEAPIAPVAEAPVVEAPVEAATPGNLTALVDVPPLALGEVEEIAAPAVSPAPAPAQIVVETLAPPPLAVPQAAEAAPSSPPAQVVAAAPPPALPAASSAARRGYVPQVYGAANAEARVVLRAEGDSWVQIHGANNELVLTRMLRAGDRYQVPDRTDLVMVTGNAGAIEITVDGKAIPSVGPMGAVRRDISLDAERLLARMAESQ